MIQNGKILIADEEMGAYRFSKFPGGGLEYGEGISECLHREFLEESGIRIRIRDLFYVNDFFQQSAFKKDEQVISFYYIIEPLNAEEREKLDQRCLVGPVTVAPGHCLGFRWLNLDDDLKTQLHFPIDLAVAGKLQDNFRNKAD